MPRNTRITLIALCASLLALAGCTREYVDWRVAQGADTLDSYERFVREHPDSEYAAPARQRIAQLTEARDWERAAAADNAHAYRDFIAQHPSGEQAEEARIRADSSELSEARGGAVTLPPPESMPPTAAEPTPAPASPLPAPAPVPAPAPAPAPAANDAAGYAVQLGAFTSAERAHDEWQRLAASQSADLAGLTPRVVAGQAPDQLYRLQTIVADEAQARALCAQLKARGQPCVVVLPPR